ncbi:hypothetical protein [Niallia circulans]|uniref:hypothetical protein n=1 Tax=Niallia circulans TaxID=1397 RepID=UPI0026EDCB4D|nr:hypothetical protein [Niallia circulans]
MQKYIEVDMQDYSDLQKLCKEVEFLLKNGYEINLVQKIGGEDLYGIHLQK